MRVSIHTIGQMTLEALEQALKNEIKLQQSRLPGRQNWNLTEAIETEIDTRKSVGKSEPLSIEDFLG